MSKKELTISWLKAAFVGSLPLLGVLILCAFQGQSIFHISLLHSEWNDELFYYKQVEAILEYGFPQGFFGFNESKAELLSFAAWSPVLVVPWIVWGFIFGWGLNSPMICNVVIMMIAFFFFAKVTSLKGKNIVAIAVLYLTNFFFHRYVLSGMAEAICASFLIMFITISYLYLKKEKTWYLNLLFLLVVIGTLMRPYLLMLLLFPSYYYIKKNKIVGSILTFAIMSISLISYALVNHYLGASYFTPLFKTEWIAVFSEQGVMSGILGICKEMYYALDQIYYYLINFSVYQDAIGGIYLQFILVVIILGISVWGKRKEKNIPIILGRFVFCFDIVMFFAILLLYHINQGSRHLLLFTTISVIALGAMESRRLRRASVIGLIFMVSFMQKPYNIYMFDIKPQSDKVEIMYESIGYELRNKIKIHSEIVPSFDNVIIWTLNDKVDGVQKNTNWQMLYGVPSGMGINCCEASFVLDNLNQIQSKYVATVPNGEVEKMMIETGKIKLVDREEIVVYQLR